MPVEWLVVATVYVMLRLLPAAYGTPALTADSASYLHPVRLESQPPLTAAVYDLLAHDLRGIVLFQAALSAAAWLVLALVAGQRSHRFPLWSPVTLGILGLSLCDIVGRWDTAILSDSMSLSLGVLVLASLIYLRNGVTLRRTLAVAVLAILWSFSRDLNVLFVLGGGALTLAVIAGRWVFGPTRRRPGPSTAAVLALTVVAALALIMADHEGRPDAPFDDVVGVRILADPAATAYFEKHGMPTAVLVMRGHYTGPIVAADPFFADPALASYRHWATTKGRITYLTYLLTHPRWALSAAFGNPETLAGPLTSPPLNLYGASNYQSLLPTEIQQIFFVPSNAALVLETAAMAALALLAGYRGTPDEWAGRTEFLAVSIGAAGCLYCVAACLSGGIETGRHALFGVVAIRIAMIFLGGTAVARLMAARSNTASSYSLRPNDTEAVSSHDQCRSETISAAIVPVIPGDAATTGPLSQASMRSSKSG
jgi:hypothetical protein